MELQLFFLLANSYFESWRGSVFATPKASDYAATKCASGAIIKNMYMANQPLCFSLHKFGQCSVELYNAKFVLVIPSSYLGFSYSG